MAGFADLVASGVALANQLTGTLQDDVLYQAWIGQDLFGDYEYSDGVSLGAIVERKQDLVTDYEGQEVVSSHTISLLKPVLANGTPGRSEPIDPRDKFTLSDGTTGRILSVETLMNPVTGAGYYQVVKLGGK